MRHILVVEDDEDLRDLIGEMLVGENYQITSAVDGIEGLERAIALEPDLILSDIKMPHMTGYKMLEQIRQHEKLKNVPVIFMSNLATREHQRLGMNLGADDYLPKCFTKEQLLDSVQARLQRLTSLQQEQLNQQNEFARRLAISIPHELRTPLFGIMGNSSLLLESYQTLTREEIFECVQDIHVSAERLSILIKDYIDYANLYLNQPKLRAEVARRESTQLNVVFLQALGSYVAKKYDRLTDLQIGEITPIDLQIGEITPIDLQITTNRLYEVLRHLIDNGFKFSKPGQVVQLSAWQDGEFTVIKIADQGRGLTPAQINRIAPFQQFERDKQEQQGMGLGLAIAKSIVEMFGGRLQINSVYGQFTHVLCSLKNQVEDNP